MTSCAHLPLGMPCAGQHLRAVKEGCSSEDQHLLQGERLNVLERVLHHHHDTQHEML